MCHPTCRDPRPPKDGDARAAADALERHGLPPAAMSGWLADQLDVARFRDLCYSHADAIVLGLTKGVLADDVAQYVP